jgi:UDPglucose 6-dehydrogenase
VKRHPSLRAVVIGGGYVGLITAVGLSELGHRVHLVEIRPDRLDRIRRGEAPIFEAGLPETLATVMADGRMTASDESPDDADVALICVGTPIGSDGRSHLSQLESALRAQAPKLRPGVPLVIRSTLPPGSTRLAVEWSGVPSSRVFTNPEFLRQGTALSDFRSPSRIVIGRFADADPAALAVVESLYEGIAAPRLIVDVAASELIKNGANAFLALKLSFANEIASLSEEYGTDVGDVLAGLSLDPRIGSQYMRPSFGFGGSCLPKELQALATAGGDRGLSMHVTQAASDANAAQQVRFAGRIATLLGGLEGRRIAILGLAFKAGTDDVRDSPAVALAARLIAGGAIVRAHDPQAAENAVMALPGLATAGSADEAMAAADAVVIATEWPEYRDLDWAAIRERLGAALVVDGRRLLDAAQMRRLGYRYETVGGLRAEASNPALVPDGEEARGAGRHAQAEDPTSGVPIG